MRFLLFLGLLASLPAWSQAPLPPEVDAALARARLPRDAVTFLVADVDGRQPPRLSHRADVAVNPASIAKLATTFAALELLGPAYSWTTALQTDGVVTDGTLHGHLYVRGQGDPKLVSERLWLLMRKLRAQGIRHIAGDLVLDRSAFDLPARDPGAFDGEPLRPYNAAPDALLLNYKSAVLTFSPRGTQAVLQVEPPLANVTWPAAVPLAAGECGDWRAALKPDFSDPAHPRFAGALPLACGERTWPLALADPRGYAGRAIAGMWKEVGGTLAGTVRDGMAPVGAAIVADTISPPLAEAVRDVNKYSNNVMAQQLFLTLSLHFKGVGTYDGSREVLQGWWRDRIGPDLPVFDNGSGLSRDGRITAQQLARLLQYAWASPLMPELLSSLPIAGVDGTLRRTRGTAPGAHLKSGSLRDVWGVAGYVHGATGRRYVLVAIANHPNANGMRPAVEALLGWVGREP